MTILIYITLGIITAYISFHFLLHKNSLTQLKKTNDKGERWASQKKPIIGGIGFYILFIYSYIFYLIYTDFHITNSNEFITLLIVSSLGFFSGLFDDIKGSTPRLKLIIQIIIGLIVILSGNHINSFSTDWINYPITLFWFVALMNSINMLDNMDAITTSVSATIIASLVVIEMYMTKQFSSISFISIGVFISLILFLKWNWNPSKMYMGDNGSQFLGAFIAFAGIKILWNNNVNHISEFPIKEIIAVAFAFIVMISDTATVTINRLRAGKSPFIGGRDHTTHHLSYLGLTERQVALTLISISILANIATFFVICISRDMVVWQSILWLVIAFLIFGCLYSTTIFGKPKNL